MTRDGDGKNADPGDEAVETRIVEESPAASETVVAPETSEVDDDRTQVVPRDSASGAMVEDSSADDAGSPAAAGARPPRIRDSEESPVAGGGGTRRLPDTRVIDDPDGAASLPIAGSAEPSPARPKAKSIDPERGLAAGTVLFGEYEIVNVLGVGGMGEVYRARHRRLDEYRAIKVMHAELSKKKGASEFFYREAKALLAVRHPAVVHCHDLLSDEEGRVYLIMEMIEGIPLSKRMNDGPLSPDDVAILGARVSHGLSAAHRKGVIHRDVSPDNIVLPNGRVQEAKIIDFGIAKLLEEGEGTIVDGFKGKLSYASPEQLGFFGGKIDGRSDFYSLGLVLAAAALGRPMGMGVTVVEAVDARRSLERLPDGVPIGLRSAIQPLLALDPDDRPRYVDRLFVVPGGVEGMSEPGGISTGQIARSGGAERAGPGQTVLIAAGVVTAMLVLGAVLYLATDRDPQSIDTSISPSEPAALTQDRATVVLQEPAPVVVKPETPKPRRLAAGDRIKIIGLINNAKLAVEENRLMSPAGDNAYDRYGKVLQIDPSDKRALDGLREIAARYVAMANRAVDRGDLEQARSFIDRARKADADHPGIASVESRLGR